LDHLIGDHDVYLSMHRAEGLGLLMAKAMSRQKAVAATRWSGNLDYMTDATSLLVDCTPTTIVDENMNTTDPVACAEPDVSDAASKILALAADRQRMRALGRRASARIDAVSELALDHNRLHLFHALA
jgi:glycosyltransferase involved in cell wall biosynthesis